ncbi:MAG: phosphotransferase, partial [Cellulomonadaceae bacterium]
WLLSAAIPGRLAVDPVWLAEPATAARALGSGLRELHDTLPLDQCPFTWADDDRIAAAERRLAAGLGPESWHPEHRALGVAGARARLADRPPPDRLVVCHGDACAPNTLLGDTGAVVGHVDLGTLGVADRWADLAVAAWSTEWNYGPGYAEEVYAAYGVPPDREREAFYRLLWDLA